MCKCKKMKKVKKDWEKRTEKFVNIVSGLHDIDGKMEERIEAALVECFGFYSDCLRRSVMKSMNDWLIKAGYQRFVEK